MENNNDNVEKDYIEYDKNDETRETLLKVENLSKLYGVDKKEAMKLKKQGLSKDEVYDKTKVTIALWDVN
jgi:glycine betaine/proline transport system ATP-binding protein